MRPFFLSALVLLAASGCAATTRVRGDVVHPAAMPVRAFPRIWVAHDAKPQEATLAEGLAQHLEIGGESEVRVVSLGELEPARLAGRIPMATAVVLVKLAFAESFDSRWTSRPQTVCSSVGCYTSRRTYRYEVPTLRANLTLTVYDGPTATVQQVVHLDASEEGREYPSMRNRAAATLLRKANELVDQRVETVDVTLLDVDHAQTTQAIAHIDAGDWSAGRRELERIADDLSATGLAREDQARLLYDLGMARLYDASTLGDPPAHYAAATRALAAAQRLDPQARYEEAIAGVAVHRQRFEQVQMQLRAAAANFQAAGTVPEAPAHYQTPSPEAESEAEAESETETAVGAETATETEPR